MTERVRNCKAVQRLVSQVVDNTRAMEILERDISAKRAEIARMNTLGQEKFASRENDLVNLSMLVLQLQAGGMGGLNVDQIFIDGDDPQLIERRHTVGDMIKNLRFLYTFDPVAELDEESRRVVVEHTQDWNIHMNDPLDNYRDRAAN